MTEPTENTSASVSDALNEVDSRPWRPPKAIAAIAILVAFATLGLGTSAFAMPSADAGAGTAKPVVAVTFHSVPGSIPFALTQGPVIVLVTNDRQNIVELTPSGALVILVRFARSEPVVRIAVARIGVARPETKVEAPPVLTSTVTAAKMKQIPHEGWRGDWLVASRWSGGPDGWWHPYARFSDRRHRGYQPQSKSTFTGGSGDPSGHCRH
jgi:hypothetical protein